MIDAQPTRRLPLRRRRHQAARADQGRDRIPTIGLRVYVYSGGCSGYRYGMMLEDAPTPEDSVLERQRRHASTSTATASPLHPGLARSTTSTPSWAPASRSTTRTRSRAAAAAPASGPPRTPAPRGAAPTDDRAPRAPSLESLTTPSGSPGGVFMSRCWFTQDRRGPFLHGRRTLPGRRHADPAVPAPHGAVARPRAAPARVRGPVPPDGPPVPRRVHAVRRRPDPRGQRARPARRRSAGARDRKRRHVRGDPRGQPLRRRPLGAADRGRGPVRHRDRQDRARALPRGGGGAAR